MINGQVDRQALRELIRELVGAMLLYKDNGTDPGTSVEYGALVRATGYTLGGQHSDSDWRALCMRVRSAVANACAGHGAGNTHYFEEFDMINDAVSRLVTDDNRPVPAVDLRV